jgi:hypothetical protein
MIVSSDDVRAGSAVALVGLAGPAELDLIMSEPRIADVRAWLSETDSRRSSVIIIDTWGRRHFFQEGPGGNDCSWSNHSTYLAWSGKIWRDAEAGIGATVLGCFEFSTDNLGRDRVGERRSSERFRGNQLCGIDEVRGLGLVSVAVGLDCGALVRRSTHSIAGPRMLPTESAEIRELTVEGSCSFAVLIMDAVDPGDNLAIKRTEECRTSGRVSDAPSSLSLTGEAKTARTTKAPTLNGMKSRSKFVGITSEGVVSASSSKRLKALKIRKSVIVSTWCLHLRKGGVIKVMVRATT